MRTESGLDSKLAKQTESYLERSYSDSEQVRFEPRSMSARFLRPSLRASIVVMVVAVSTIVFSIPIQIALAVLIIVGGVVLMDMWTLVRKQVFFERSAIPTLSRGVPIPFRARVDVLGARSIRLRIVCPPEIRVNPAEVGSNEVLGTLVGLNRGVHTLPASVARVHGVLGLCWCDIEVGTPTPVSVYPDLPRARRLAFARRHGRSSEEGRLYSRLGLGTEFETIREYTPDDDVRQINWIATARVGHPMSNQFRIDENRDLICLIDSGRLMASPIDSSTRLDIALDAMAVLAVEAQEQGDRVGVVAFDSEVTHHISPRRHGVQAVVQSVFDLEPSEIESNYERAFNAVGFQKRALIAIFTDLADSSMARTLVEAVPILVRRHSVMIVTCRDPYLVSTLHTEPDRLIDVMRMSVALEILSARDRAAYYLKSMGASVVESSPEKLGINCASAYQRLKERARI